MTPKQIHLVQRSFCRIVPIADVAAEIFYARLFELDPALRTLFHSDLKEQGQKLMMALGVVARSLRNFEEIVPTVVSIAECHARYGVRDTDYATAGHALIDTLRRCLGVSFSNELRDAWLAAYTLLSETMIAATDELKSA